MLSVETCALTRSFGRIQAVRELDLAIEEGSVYALMGPNGAGKSTFIKLLMNLISPSSGCARLLGMESRRLRGRPLEEIGYVSENQKPPEWMTVEQYLSYCRPFYPKWDRELEKQLVVRFELKPGQRLKRLSRGLRMKAALASVLAFRPRLLILDEPLSGLDPLVRDELLEGLNELKHETTILLSSHDLAEIDSFASHVGYLDGGRLLLSTTMEDLRHRFRRVEAAAGRPVEAPAMMPTEWMSFASTVTGACWMEREYDETVSVRRAADVFPGAEVTARSLSLREVFLAMAHAERESKGGAR
jgi:ABC-2 type transport system ATP-binding protein